MLSEIILILVSIYYLYHGLYPLITGKPVFKSYGVRKILIILLTVLFLLLLRYFFLVFVKSYGSVYGNIVIGNDFFYMLLILLCALILWFFYRQESDSIDLKYNVTLIAVDSDYALTAVRETLADMAIAHQETLSGFEIPDKDITVSVKTSNNQICFSVAKPLDKIFLNQFCRKYQNLYKRRQYPIKRNMAMLSTALGLTALMTLVLILVWLY